MLSEAKHLAVGWAPAPRPRRDSSDPQAGPQNDNCEKRRDSSLRLKPQLRMTALAFAGHSKVSACPPIFRQLRP